MAYTVTVDNVTKTYPGISRVTRVVNFEETEDTIVIAFWEGDIDSVWRVEAGHEQDLHAYYRDIGWSGVTFQFLKADGR